MDQAELFEQKLRNRNFLVHFMFSKDVLKHLVTFCKDLQKSPGKAKLFWQNGFHKYMLRMNINIGCQKAYNNQQPL